MSAAAKARWRRGDRPIAGYTGGPKTPEHRAKISKGRALAAEMLEAGRNPLMGKRVRLSEVGLAATGMSERGFGPDTRGTVVKSNWPEKIDSHVIAVLADGLETKEHWLPQFWTEDVG